MNKNKGVLAITIGLVIFIVMVLGAILFMPYYINENYKEIIPEEVTTFTVNDSHLKDNEAYDAEPLDGTESGLDSIEANETNEVNDSAPVKGASTLSFIEDLKSNGLWSIFNNFNDSRVKSTPVESTVSPRGTNSKTGGLLYWNDETIRTGMSGSGELEEVKDTYVNYDLLDEKVQQEIIDAYMYDKGFIIDPIDDK